MARIRNITIKELEFRNHRIKPGEEMEFLTIPAMVQLWLDKGLAVRVAPPTPLRSENFITEEVKING
jgi:hypothetical protein